MLTVLIYYSGHMEFREKPKESEENKSSLEKRETVEYRNSVPVAVLLQKVIRADGKTGLIVIRRGNPHEDGHNLWALPGGYVEIEDLRKALAREVLEELSISLESSQLGVVDVQSVPDGTKHLIFLKSPVIAEEELPSFQPNLEIAERRVIISTDEVEWAYPLHHDQAECFLSS